jgi:beta-lactamase class A
MNPSDECETLRLGIEEITRESRIAAHAVVVHDYDSDRRIAINADRRFHAASTIKVAILLALFKAVDDQRVRLDDPLHVRNRFVSAYDGRPFRLDADSDGFPQLYRRLGRTAKISELADTMITSSSNLATNLLLDFLGVEYARDVLTQAGINGVDLRRGVEDERAHAAGLNNETTAEGLQTLFATLRGDFLSKSSRDCVINILLSQRFNSMIPAGLPAHASVAHKTGEISTACHDAGIVYLPEREPYILIVLTEISSSSDSAREAIAKISKAVYEFLTKTRAGT